MARNHSKPNINLTGSLIRRIFRRRFIVIKIHNVKSQNVSTKPFCLSAVAVYILRISVLVNLNVARLIFYLPIIQHNGPYSDRKNIKRFTPAKRRYLQSFNRCKSPIETVSTAKTCLRYGFFS